MIGVPLRVYAPRNKFIFHGKFNYTFFPEYYYGVATEDPESKKDTIEYNRIAFDLRFYWKIKRHLFAGFATRYNNISNVDAGPNGKFYEDEPLGHDGYWLLGFAPALTFETRDNFVYPRKGLYVEALYFIQPSWNGNSYQFNSLKLDI